MNRTYREITRQYENLQKTIAFFETKKEGLHRFYQENPSRSILFFGSGSSYCLAQSAEKIACMQFGFHSFSVPAGDAMVNFPSYRSAFRDSIAVAVSRSGSTTEIMKTIDLLHKELRVPVVGITCVKDSELSRAADRILELPWAFDESVCQTGTVSNLYAAESLLLAGFAGKDEVFADFKKAASMGESFISHYEEEFKKLAKEEWDHAVILADGELSGIACEAALAFKEMSGTNSNFYHVLDVRHGPMVLLDSRTLVLVDLQPWNREYQLQLVEDVVKRGAKVVVCTDNSFEPIRNVALHIRHEPMGNIAKGLPFLNIAQLTAYYRALDKGIDPGEPEGLDAWIQLS